MCCFSVVPVCLGKGQWLARQIQTIQKKRSVLESQIFMNTSEYFSEDESDDSFHASLDGNIFLTFEDMESDGDITVFTSAFSTMTCCSFVNFVNFCESS